MLVFDCNDNGDMFVMVTMDGSEVPDTVQHEGETLTVMDGTLLDGGKVYTLSSDGTEGVFECHVFGFQWLQVTADYTFSN